MTEVGRAPGGTQGIRVFPTEGGEPVAYPDGDYFVEQDGILTIYKRIAAWNKGAWESADTGDGKSAEL